MKTKLYTFLLSSLLCTGALADNEPWQNPQVNEPSLFDRNYL